MQRKFDSPEKAWFWFMLISQHGRGFSCSKVCTPRDILEILESLYKKGQLTRDHLLILRHYGKRQDPPHGDRRLEARASILWQEAMVQLQEVFSQRGII